MSMYESLTNDIERAIQLAQTTKVAVHWHIAQGLIAKRDCLSIEHAEREVIQWT